MVVGLLTLLSYHLGGLFFTFSCYLCIIPQQKRELTEQIEIMVAGRAGVMLMLAVAAQGLLVIALATEVFDSLAGEEHNKENGDNDKRHKR